MILFKVNKNQIFIEEDKEKLVQVSDITNLRFFVTVTILTTFLSDLILGKRGELSIISKNNI